MIKAIETRYAGCHFRSRIEARWAVFLDHMGIEWQYEPQGFELPSGPYLPDFHLPVLNTWLEIKGIKPTPREQQLASELAAATKERVVILDGDIPRTAVGHHWLAPVSFQVAAANALGHARAARFEHGQQPVPPTGTRAFSIAAAQATLTHKAPAHEVRCLNCKTQTKSTTERCRKCGDRLK